MMFTFRFSWENIIIECDHIVVIADSAYSMAYSIGSVRTLRLNIARWWGLVSYRTQPGVGVLQRHRPFDGGTLSCAGGNFI